MTRHIDELREDQAANVTGQPPRQGDVPFTDLPGGIWRAFPAVWVAFFATLWWIFGGASESAYMVGVATAFGVVFFAIPMAMYRIARQPTALSGTGMVETLTGPLTAGAAAVQIVLVPLAVTLGLIAMAFLAL